MNLEAVIELLYKIADDQLILGHRNSEWTGLGPLLEEASKRFDRIIIDTAPINAVSDTFLILHLAQMICLVVRSGKTSRRVIARAVELMARAGVPPSGIVLNYLPKSSGHGRHYYYAPKNSYYTRSTSANGSARRELLNTQ